MLANGHFASGRGVCTWVEHVRQHKHISAAPCGQGQTSGQNAESATVQCDRLPEGATGSSHQPTLGQPAAPLLGTDLGGLTCDLSGLAGRLSSFGRQGGPEVLPGIVRAGNGRLGVQVRAGAVGGAEAPGGVPAPAPATPGEGGPEGSILLILGNYSAHPRKQTTYDEPRSGQAEGPTPPLVEFDFTPPPEPEQAAPENLVPAENLGEVKRQNDRYAKGKKHARRVAAAMSELDPRRGQIERCGNVLYYRHWLQTGNTKLHAYASCGLPRLCGFCAIRRASKISGRYVERVRYLLERNPGLVVAFVTLTQETGDDLCERVANLVRSLSVMTTRRSRQRKGRRTVPTVLASVAGGVGSIEVKRSKGDPTKWHPHYHGIWLLERFIPQADLEAEWSCHVGQAKSIVHIQEVRERWKRGTYQDAIVAGCSEALKYSVKFDAMAAEDVLQVDRWLKGKQLLRPFGDLYGVKLPESDTDEPEEGPYVELCYKYLAGQYRLTEVAESGPKYEEWQP